MIETAQELDQLFQLPLAEFTRARNRLSSTLRKSGDAAASMEVKSLTKPSVSAWAVNQLYWRQRDRFDALINAADGFRAVEQQALAGGGSEALEGAEQDRRQCLRDALEAIEAILIASGQALSPVIMRRVATSLDALASYGSASPVPLNGRLASDLEPPGFAALAALARAEPLPVPEALQTQDRKMPPQSSTQTAFSPKRQKAQEELTRAEKSLADLETAETDAQATVRRDEMRAHDAAEELERARAYLERSKTKVEETAKRLEDARGQLDKARSDREAARTQLAAARERIQTLDDDAAGAGG